MQAAEKLQKLLEGYKPPKNLGKNKENWRIFRDVSELQSSSDLSEDISSSESMTWSWTGLGMGLPRGRCMYKGMCPILGARGLPRTRHP